MTIHLGRRASREGWVSFETHPQLRRTKERLHARCLPCLTGLLEQLKGGGAGLELREAWECWKVVAVLAGPEECLAVLEEFSLTYPQEYVYGKFGRGGEDREGCAVIFHTERQDRCDQLLALLGEVAARRSPTPRVFCSRACGRPYAELLGPWEEWSRVTPLRHPERVDRVKSALRQSLYGQDR